MLTDAALRNLKPKDKAYKVADRDGLYVYVLTSGTISFRYNYAINGRQETLVLGRYGPDGIRLSEARELLTEAKKTLAAGRSPARQKVTAILTTSACAHLFREMWIGFGFVQAKLPSRLRGRWSSARMHLWIVGEKKAGRFSGRRFFSLMPAWLEP